MKRLNWWRKTSNYKKMKHLFSICFWARLFRCVKRSRHFGFSSIFIVLFSFAAIRYRSRTLTRAIHAPSRNRKWRNSNGLDLLLRREQSEAQLMKHQNYTVFVFFVVFFSSLDVSSNTQSLCHETFLLYEKNLNEKQADFQLKNINRT